MGLKGFPENQVETENKRLNKARETLKTEKTEQETLIKVSNEAVINLPKLEYFVKLMQHKISALDYDSKRQVLDMLDTTVWLDGQTVEITGILDTEGVVTADMRSQ